MLPWWLRQISERRSLSSSFAIFRRNFLWKTTTSFPRKVHRHEALDEEEDKRCARKLLVAVRISETSYM